MVNFYTTAKKALGTSVEESRKRFYFTPQYKPIMASMSECTLQLLSNHSHTRPNPRGALPVFKRLTSLGGSDSDYFIRFRDRKEKKDPHEKRLRGKSSRTLQVRTLEVAGLK
jgi:hypothetical protein